MSIDYEMNWFLNSSGLALGLCRGVGGGAPLWLHLAPTLTIAPVTYFMCLPSSPGQVHATRTVQTPQGMLASELAHLSGFVLSDHCCPQSLSLMCSWLCHTF